MRLALLLLLLPLLSFAHNGLPTRLLFVQDKDTISLRALFDPLLLSGGLRERGVELTLSQSSLDKAAPALGLWLDERLILSADDRECTPSKDPSLSLQEGGVIQVERAYQCKVTPARLMARCTLFDGASDPHPIEAIFQFGEETTPFLFDTEHTVFSRAPKALVAPPPKEETQPSFIWSGLLHSMKSPLHWLFALLLALLPRARWVWLGVVLGALAGVLVPAWFGVFSLVSLVSLLSIVSQKRTLPAWALCLLGALLSIGHTSDLLYLTAFLWADLFRLLLASLFFDLLLSLLLGFFVSMAQAKSEGASTAGP